MADTLADQADKARDERDRKQREEAFKAQQDAEKRTDEWMGSDEFVVLAPYVTLKMHDGVGGFVIKGFNEGAVVKAEDVDDENLRHHCETLLIAPPDAREARFAGPAGTPKPGEPPNVAVTEQPVESLSHEERLKRQAAAADKEPARAPGRPRQGEQKRA